MKRKKFLLLLIPLALLLIFGEYVRRGGLESPKVELLQLEARTLHGQQYNGALRDRHFRFLQETYGDLLYEEKIQGKFCQLFETPLDELDSVAVFVGTLVRAGHEHLPDSTTTRYLPAGQYVRASIDADPSVAPGPLKMQAEIRAFAVSEGITLSEQFIEFYQVDGQLVIEVPVKGKAK